MKKAVLYFIAILSINTAVDSQSISEWRNNGRTGIYNEKGLMQKWPEAGPDLLWFNEVLPKGFSSVSFSNNTIFTTGINDQKDVLVALDTLGVIKWQTPYGRAWKDGFPESRCTPTVEGNKVYVSSGLGDVACIDATTGTIVWTVLASEIYKGTYGPWGIAESLIIDGEKLYFTPGGPETMTIALNKNTGNLIWKSESLNDIPAYVSPVIIEHEGKKYLMNVSGSYIFAINPADGVIVWKVKHSEINVEKCLKVWGDAPKIKCVTPIYNNGKLYVTGGYNHGGIMLNLTEGGKNATVAWVDSVLDVHLGGVVLINGNIYGSNWLNNSDGSWCCIDWNTGQKKYEEHWKCKGSIIANDGLLYIYDEKSGFVGLLNANPKKFDLVSSFKAPKGSGPNWAHPVIHNGKLYIRHGNALMAYNLKSK